MHQDAAATGSPPLIPRYHWPRGPTARTPPHAPPPPSPSDEPPPPPSPSDSSHQSRCPPPGLRRKSRPSGSWPSSSPSQLLSDTSSASEEAAGVGGWGGWWWAGRVLPNFIPLPAAVGHLVCNAGPGPGKAGIRSRRACMGVLHAPLHTTPPHPHPLDPARPSAHTQHG